MPAPAPTGLPAAALLGAAVGMRTFTAPAVLAAGRRGPGGRAPRLAAGLAVGELVYDKLPFAPSRLAPDGLGARAVTGALAGGTAAGPAGLLVGSATALASAFACHGVRRAAGRRTGVPDALTALGEDALAIGLAVAATRRLP